MEGNGNWAKTDAFSYRVVLDPIDERKGVRESINLHIRRQKSWIGNSPALTKIFLILEERIDFFFYLLVHMELIFLVAVEH